MDGNAGLSHKGRLDSLTGARFIAAFMVFLFHVATMQLFTPETGITQTLTFVTKSAGTIGVSFFFVLSGFVLTWSARPSDTYGGFLRRRLVKIYPNHLVTYCLAMLLFAAASTPLASALPNLLLLHAWVWDPQTFLGVNGPSWSLSCELLFYLTFPLLLSLVNRMAVRRLWWWAAGVVAVILVLPTVAGLLPAEPRFGTGLAGTVLAGQPITRLWFLYIFPPARLLDFLLGILVARIVLSGRWIKLTVAPAVLLTVLGYVLGLFVPLVYTVDAVTVIPLALLIGALAAAEARGTASVLGTPVLRKLGECSFAFYLVHEIVLLFLRAMVGFDRRLPALYGSLIVALGFALSLTLAFLLFSFVETPAVRRWGRYRRSTPSGRPAHAAPVAGDASAASLGRSTTPGLDGDIRTPRLNDRHRSS